MPRGRRHSAAGLHRPAKPVGETIGDGYRRLRAVTGSYGQLRAVTGSLYFSARGRTYGVVKTIFLEFAGSEWCRIYCGIILPLSYDLR